MMDNGVGIMGSQPLAETLSRIGRVWGGVCMVYDS